MSNCNDTRNDDASRDWISGACGTFPIASQAVAVPVGAWLAERDAGHRVSGSAGCSVVKEPA